MRKFFMSNTNEISAFDSIEGLKAHIEALKAENEWDDDIIAIHSGVIDGKRYYGIGAEGTRVSIEDLDDFSSWWEPEWDEEIFEL